MNATDELNDASRMPLGKHKGSKMMEVPMPYLRWFVAECPSSHWHAKIKAYLDSRLAPVPKPKLPPSAFRLQPSPKSDPAKAQAAFEEFRKLKETI